jgi:hypothetical protein
MHQSESCTPQDASTSPPSHPGYHVALYLRLGCLFQDFKARPAACAMYMAIKLWQRVTKGALLGVFYGAQSAVQAVAWQYPLPVSLITCKRT